MNTFYAHSSLLCKFLRSSVVQRSKYRSTPARKSGMNVFTQKRNPITGETEWGVENEDYDYHQEIARSAFADMLHDTERNKKYELAIKLAVMKMHANGKPANVLDIGTGTGLLSIFAARAGADTITACEAFKPMAECCLKILRQNGFADKIKVVPKRSTSLVVGEDMDQKANVLVTEVFDTELIGEGAISTYTHAHKHLLEEDCICVPHSAIIYAQIAECYHLRKWNEVEDLHDNDNEEVLKMPPKMKKCPGTPAVHDIQLSHLLRHQFIELTDPIPILFYDWSGRTPIEKNVTVKQKVNVVCPGKAHVVFMWWELQMDPQAKIRLSCAPWWKHPFAHVPSLYPQDTIPWRDHWMQGVYYLPHVRKLRQFADVKLIACQDEYSLWFDLEDEHNQVETIQRPACECGLHMVYSRTHINYLNDRFRSNRFLKGLKKELKDQDGATVLDLNGSCYMGLAASKMGAKKVYILETNNLIINVINEFIRVNNIENVTIISEITDDIIKDVTLITCDPNYSNAIMPWENLKMAHILYKVKDKIGKHVTYFPESVEFVALPVEFVNLHKIRIPVGNCEGIDMSAFDELVETSRVISDSEMEAQPLWEYTNRSAGVPHRLLRIDLRDLKPTYAVNTTLQISDPKEYPGPFPVNGFVMWAQWTVGDKTIGGGPLEWPGPGHRLFWDPSTRQAVKILKSTERVMGADTWSAAVACDLEKGQFDVSLRLTPAGDDVPEVER